MQPLESLAGRVIVVSGASRGIGRALALGFGRAGASVVCAARSTRIRPGELPGTVEDIAEQIVAAGGQAVPVRADIGIDADIHTMIGAAVASFGRLDALVNNAMITNPAAWDELTLEQWDESWRVNVRSLLVSCRAAVQVMADGGSIVNMSSGAADARNPPGILPPGYLAYSVTKAALERFSTALASEVAQRNVAVNAYRPGPVKTEKSVHELGDDYDWSAWKEPASVVPSIHCLVQQRADGITGQIVDFAGYGTTWG